MFEYDNDIARKAFELRLGLETTRATREVTGGGTGGVIGEVIGEVTGEVMKLLQVMHGEMRRTEMHVLGKGK